MRGGGNTARKLDDELSALSVQLRASRDRVLDQVSHVRGAGGGLGKGGGGPSNSPNTLQSDSIASLVLLLSEGECLGLANGLQDVYFSFSGRPSDAVPVQNANGSFNFNGVNAIFTPGTPDQDPLPGFPSVQTTVSAGQQVLVEAPFQFEISDPDADSVIITVELPALYSVSSSGSIGPNSQAVLVDLQPNGGSSTQVLETVITGLSSSSYQKSYLIPLAGSSPWVVSVRSGTPDSVSANDVRSLYVASYTINQDFALSYPDSCLLGLQVDARLFGTQIPAVFCNLQGVKFEVPANYDPVARSYATSGPGTSGGVWDGTFKTAWTNNPAWVLYGLITNGRYGLGQYVDTALVDAFGLYAIAQYCDELVPDGAGGQEPRYVYNGVIASQDDALKALQTIASCFRGMVFWGAQGVTAIADMPADPVKLVTPANVIDGMITYSGTGVKALHTVALVDWRDPSLSFEKNTQIVESPNLDDIARYGWRPISLAAAGCTSRGQANRMGLWLLYTERLQAETAVWTASWDNADLAPGDVVSIADPAYAGARFGGRVLTASRTRVTIDAAVTLEDGQTYTLLVALPDGSIGESSIANPPGPVSALTLGGALDTAPLNGAMWQINSTELEPRQFTVVSNKERESDRHLFEITALLHDPDIYDLVEFDIKLEAQVFTLLPGGGLPAPSNLSVLPGVQSTSGAATAQPAAILSWTAPLDPRITEFEAQINLGGLWQPSVFTTAPSYSFVDLPQASYNFRVRSVSAPAGATSMTSAWAELDGVDFNPATITITTGSVTTDSLIAGLKDFITNEFAAIQAATDRASGLIASVAQEQDAQNWIDKYGAALAAFANNSDLQGNINALTTTTAADYEAANSAITTNTVALSDLNNSFSDYKVTVSSEFGTVNSNVATNALAITEIDGAFAAYETTVTAEFATTNSSVTTNATAISNADAAFASYEATTNASIGSLDASVTTNATAIATTDGKLAGEYLITLDVNGYVSGLQAYNDGSSSELTIIADSFLIAQPGVAGGDPIPVFAVSDVSGSPKVVLAGDMIADGTIEAVSIVDASLTAPQIWRVGGGQIQNGATWNAIHVEVGASSGRYTIDAWTSVNAQLITGLTGAATSVVLEIAVDGVVVDSNGIGTIATYNGVNHFFTWLGNPMVATFVDAGSGNHTIDVNIVAPTYGGSATYGIGTVVLRVVELIK